MAKLNDSRRLTMKHYSLSKLFWTLSKLILFTLETVLDSREAVETRNGPPAPRERSGAGDGVGGGAPHKTQILFLNSLEAERNSK